MIGKGYLPVIVRRLNLMLPLNLMVVKNENGSRVQEPLGRVSRKLIIRE
jgi:hypothetical protein